MFQLHVFAAEDSSTMFQLHVLARRSLEADDEGAAALARANWSSLDTLNVVGNMIRAEGAVVLH